MFRAQSTALTRVDNVIDALPHIVKRDNRIVAAFARLALAEEWAQMRSFNDESEFTVVHNGREIKVWRHGEEL